MKKLAFFALLFFAFITTKAQVLDPVKWTTAIEKKSNNHYILTFNVTIENKWHLYSQFTPDGGSLPMEIVFSNQKGNYELIGKAKEFNTKKAFNDVFNVDEIFFEKKAKIQQEIRLTNSSLEGVMATLNYQVCSDRCINLEKKFTFKLPAETTEKVVAAITDKPNTLKPNIDKAAIAEQKIVLKDAPTAVNLDSKKDNQKGLWRIFFLAFLGGFAALLTPCVFPMIPMTVSFFTKQSKTKAKGKQNAIIYGLSIIIIYVVLGLAITGIFGADALNALSTDVWFNVIFFFLLVVFAVSFLGAFEIMLPNSWANKVDRQADRGGIIGILFMALALAIVSFSCTGPIVGTLLVESASKGGIAPIVGMLGFSSALALPFMLFAMFPSWLHSLPKSGGWLNTVKVSLGFLELAFSFKFLSNADLVLQLHYFERETFLAIWIAIFGTWGIYLLGKITLPHDSPIAHLSVGRLMLAIIVLAFTVYMIPGLWGAPLKLISAFPPSEEYSESPNGVGATTSIISNEKLPDGAERNKHGLVVFMDYDKGLAYAKQINRPVLLDFTGHACVNCRKMENNVWTDSNVSKLLKEEVVIISLFADDKRPLPKEQQFTSKTTGSIIETIGDKWTDLMISKYKTNTQPLYVLIGLDGENLNQKTPTTSYDPDAQLFFKWLQEGIANFK